MAETRKPSFKHPHREEGTDRDWCNAQPDAAELNDAFDLAMASGVATRSTIASLIHKLQAARAGLADSNTEVSYDEARDFEAGLNRTLYGQGYSARIRRELGFFLERRNKRNQPNTKVDADA